MNPLAPAAAFRAASTGQLRPDRPVGQAFQPPAQPSGDNLLAMLAQMAPMGGVASPMQMYDARQNLRDARQSGKGVRDAREQFRTMQSGPQLPNPMALAKEHVQAARQQFLPVRDEFRSLEGPEREAFRPELQAARGHLNMMRDWHQDLKALPYGEAIGTAAMGPPRPAAPPQMAPMMQLPQFPGMPRHDGTIGGLLDVIRGQDGGDAGGGGTGEQRAGMPAGWTQAEWDEYQNNWFHRNVPGYEFNGGGRSSNMSGT